MHEDIKLRVCQIPLVAPTYHFDEKDEHNSMLMVAHRRSGKSRGISLAISQDCSRLVREESIYKLRADVDSNDPVLAYFAPTIKQAKSIMWKYLRDDLGKFPGVEFDNAVMQARIPRPLTDDSIEIMLLASKNADRARGIKLRRAWVDEIQDTTDYALSNAISPALKDSAGTLCGTGTVDFEGVLTQRMKHYIKNKIPCFVFPAERTGVFTPEELEVFFRADPGAYAREFSCDFSAPIEGVIYAVKIAKIEAAASFNDAQCIQGIPKILACDLGVGHGFCGWTIQTPAENRVNLLNYYEGFEAVQELREELEANGELPDIIALPHDSKRRQVGVYSGSTMKAMFEHVFPECMVRDVPKTPNLREAIENVSQHLHLIHLPPKTAASESFYGWKKVKRYRRKSHKETGEVLDIIDKTGRR